MALSAGVAFVDVIPRTETFVKTLTTQMQGSLAKVQTGIAGKAALIGKALAVPLLLAGAAAIKMATDFEASMTKIEALVGIGRDQINAWRDDILELAKTVPAGPKELADALFFVTSAGLRGQEALDALTVSAKAAAAGLGETQTVADAVTSAMNSYAASGLDAERATDVLIATVREGKLPTEELAGAIGQVLPVASSLGVTFDQVGAAIASATRQGLNVARAATGIRFLLTAFTKPTQQAVEMLDQFGFSIGAVQQSLAERGLLATLQELASTFDLTTVAGKQAFATVVGGARGLSVSSILVGQNAEDVAQVFDNLANSVGATAKAFDIASQSAEFRFGTTLSSLQVAAVQVGSALLPLAETAASFATEVADALGTLEGPMTVVVKNADLLAKAFVAWLVIAKIAPAVVGLLSRAFIGLAAPFVRVGSQLTTFQRGVQTASGALDSLRARVMALRTTLTVGLTLALIALPEIIDSFSTSLRKLALDTGHTEEALKALDTRLSLLDDLSDRLSFSDFIASLDGTRDNVEQLTQAIDPAFQKLQDLGLSAEDADRHILELAGGVRTVGERSGSSAKALQPLLDIINELRPGTDNLAGSIELLIHSIGFAPTPVGAFTGSLGAGEGSINDFAAALQEQANLLETWSHDLGTGSIDIDHFTRLVEQFGFTHKDALSLADKALDSYGKHLEQGSAHVDQFGHAVQGSMRVVSNWARLSSEEVKEFRADVVSNIRDTFTSISGFSRRWEGSSRQLGRTLEQMARKVREFRLDLRELSHERGIPDAFQKWLLEQGPDTIHNFIGATDEAREAMIANFRDKVQPAFQDAKGLIEELTGKTHEAKVNADTSQAKEKLNELIQNLREATDAPWIVDIVLKRSGATLGAILPGDGAALGGIIPAQAGLITRPTILAGEGGRDEAIIPLESGQGHRVLVGAFADALREVQGGRKIVISGPVQIRMTDWGRGIGQMRGLVVEEMDERRDHRDRVRRMR